MNVKYKIIKDFPGYRVGSDGTIWTRLSRCSVNCKNGEHLKIGEKWRLMSPGKTKKGYLLATIWCNGKRHYRQVHRLVLENFSGPCPSGFVCRHLDGNPANNNLSNLCWSTQSENLSDRKLHGTEIIGSRNGRAKLTEESVREIFKQYRVGNKSQESLAKEFGVEQTRISKIVLRQSWRHLNFEA